MKTEKLITLPFIIALTCLVGFLVLLTFAFIFPEKGNESQLVKDGFITLSSILTSVVGYYFGNRSAKDTTQAVESSAASFRNAMSETLSKGIEAGRAASTHNPQ